MITILFQNDDFIAVDKPAGLSVHNAEDPENLLLLLEKQLQLEKLYPVHRLDKETSGVQLLALSQSSAKKLSDEFQGKTIQKNYVAILRGKLEEESGTWLAPLSNKAEGRKNPAGLSKERIPCETRFQVLRRSQYFTFCAFHLITGRRHQIRKHAALAQHEIVGDAIYGTPKYLSKISSLYQNNRLYLHCEKIEVLGQKIESPIPSSFDLLFQVQDKE